DVDPVRAEPVERVGRALLLVVESLVEADLLGPGDLLRRAGAADRATALELGDLADDASDRSRCGRNEHRLPLLRLSEVEQADVRGPPGQAQHPEGLRDWRKISVELHQGGAIGGVVLAPAHHAVDPVAFGERLAAGLHDLADRTALHRLADLK